MIYVHAAIELYPGTREAFLSELEGVVPTVLAEAGCIRYEPTIDVDLGLERIAAPRPNVVTIVEAWESEDHLEAHLRAPHMLSYRERVKEFVASAEIRVTTPV